MTLGSGNSLAQIYCPKCDRLEHGTTQTRMINSHSGWKCAAGLHKMTYAELMALKPRMEKLVINEKQPGNTSTLQIWIYPEALTALRNRFPSNLMTTICSLFTSLADPDTLVIEGEHMRELRTLGIHRGRDIVGLATTVKALTAQLDEAKKLSEQYSGIAKLLAAFSGGGGLGGGLNTQGPPAELLAQALSGSGPEDKPPAHPAPVPFIDPESDQLYYEPVTPGSFGDADLTQSQSQVATPTRNQVVKFGGNPPTHQ